MNYGSTTDRRTTLVQQQAAEIQSLRKQLTEARGGKPLPNDAKPATGPSVEYRQSPEALVALRKLLVAVENTTGPEKGETPLPVSKELADAMKAAAALVRKPKKP